jgi:hypothetical protein
VAMSMPVTVAMFVFMLVFMLFLLILSIIAIKQLPIILLHLLKNSGHHDLVILQPSLVMRAPSFGELELKPPCFTNDSGQKVGAH